MNITMNPKKLTPSKDWTFYRKVRAVIEHSEKGFILSKEGGKYIFPGGKCEPGEDELSAIQREIREELGMLLSLEDFHKVLQIEMLSDDFYNYRTLKKEPRHMITTYYYVKTEKTIQPHFIQLTEGEKKEGYVPFYADYDILLTMLNEDHSDKLNGKFFDEENHLVMEKILLKR